MPLRHATFELLLVQLDGDFKGSLECGPGAQSDAELEIDQEHPCNEVME